MPKAGAEALFGMRPALQDQLAKGGSGRANRSGLAANALDGPVGIAPMARRHVLGHGGVPTVAAGAQMSGDPLALQKDLDGTRRQPRLDLTASKAVGDAVEVVLDLDMVVDADPTNAPFGKAIGLRGQRLEAGPVELFEQRPASNTETTDQAFIVELPQQLTDRRIELGQAVKAAMAQAAEQPPLALEPITASWQAEPVETEPAVGQHRLVPFRQFRGVSGD